MLKTLSFLAALTISNAYALSLQTVMCSPKAGTVKDVAFVVASEAGKTSVTGLIQRDGDSLLPADSCFSYKQAPKEVKANIKNSAGIVGICVYITSDDGSGDMAVLKREGKEFRAYLKQVVIDSPNTEMGELISCY
ncbi:MAG: hypothetical protein A2X86_02680 [Bdellovibrionales bacterium GWA2_49_15]|nr:MAG: hypothetical protein A2X86_02680 [Bdellovibrionales bacterium GWA2_49_15]HAZ14156.1 hypothetical protein [Bdellovibrionales bacterium]